MKYYDEQIKAGIAALLMLLCLSGATVLNAQQVPGSFKASWVGNTFGKGGPASSLNHAWVQNYIDCMVVAEDGTCYTTSIWDEGGRRYGVYRDGQVLGNNNRNISCTQVLGWSISGNTIRGYGKTITGLDKPTAIAMGRGDYAGFLLVADDGPRKQILIYDVSGDPALVEKVGVEGGVGADFHAAYDFPEAINSKAFPAGHYPPGYYHPLKFWTLTGVGMDDRGRLFVSSSELGASICCFKKDQDDRWILDWKVENFIFVDNGDFDRTNDGIDIYGVQERFRIDFSQEAQGAEWSIHSITLDAVKYPNDPRGIWWIKAGHEHGLTSALIRYIDGKRFLFVNGMTCQWTWVFRFIEGTDIAVPSVCFTHRHRIYDIKPDIFWPPNIPATGGHFIWRDINGDVDFQAEEFTPTSYGHTHAWHVDQHGAIWGARGHIVHRYVPQGLDQAGNPVYHDDHVERYSLLGVGGISRVFYLEEHDRIYVYSGGCRHLKDGRLYVVNNLSGGNRQAQQVTRLKGDNPSAIDISWPYLFEVGWETRGKCWVTDLRTGETVGTIEPYGDAGTTAYTGWVDIGYGITAFQRSNGEYVVLVEDDGWGKILMYRWCPEGDCPENCTMDAERVEVGPQALQIEGFGSEQLLAIVYPDSVCDNKVKWSSSDITVARVDHTGKVTSVSPGEAYIRAVSNLDSALADSCLVTVSDVELAGIHFVSDSLVIPAGRSKATQLVYIPSNTFDRQVMWESLNEEVVAINQDGIITALKPGETNIVARAVNGGFTDTCHVTVIPVPVEGVWLDIYHLNLWVGNSTVVLGGVIPEDAYNRELIWTISDSTIAQVDSTGLVTALKAGETLLTVETAEGGFQDHCTVRVLADGELAGADVGQVCVEGSLQVDEQGVYTVIGSGRDIWHNADGFHFAYMEVSGNQTVIARVLSLENTNPWAKAGVMFRESLDAGSRHAMMVITPANGTSMQWRSNSNGPSDHQTPGNGLKAPVWVRMIRQGNVFSGYQSLNGIHWSKVGEITTGMNTTVYAGLCVTSHEECTPNMAVFDHVIITDRLDTIPFDVTSVRSIDTGGFLVYPNPANNLVSLAMEESPGGPVNIRIFDMAGHLRYSKVATFPPGVRVLHIDVSTLGDGLYIVEAGNEPKKTFRLLIQR